jgi:AhpD family alkylhydroperoxidase
MKQMFGQVPDWMEQMPDNVLPGFWTVMRDFHLAETNVPNKYKELMGIAVAGATRCRYCAYFHAQAARLFGATDAEIAEAASMAGLSMMASTFLNAQQVNYEQFVRQTDEMLDHVRQQGREKPQEGGAASAHV